MQKLTARRWRRGSWRQWGSSTCPRRPCASARLRRLDYVYVIFDHAYFAALEVIRAPFLASANIVSTGRYGGWNYSAMEDALRFGTASASDRGGADPRMEPS